MSLEWLDRDLTTSAYLWRLERGDGIAIGFTSHDRDLVIDAFRYRSAPGMVPTSIALSDSLEIDNVEIAGVMTSSAIAEADLMAGRWDGAILYISLTDGEQPDVEPSALICAEFGDRQCKLSLHRHQREGRVISVEEDVVGVDVVAGVAADYRFGSLRFLDGPNCGLHYAIIDGQGDSVRLADLPFRPVRVGARVLLTQGCDKNFATCRDRFANSINFRGEPYLPGNDLLTRYPGT